jgi:hypothetical protein
LVHQNVFYNISTFHNLAFRECAERIECGNDGTSYAEFVDLNEDRRAEWIDANFNNVYVGTGNHPFAVNSIWWGKQLGVYFCAQMEGFSAPSGSVSDLSISMPEVYGGHDFLILALDATSGFVSEGGSVTGADPASVMLAGEILGTGGTLDYWGSAWIDWALEAVPALEGQSLQVCAVILDPKSGGPMYVTNAVDASLCSE